jgi:dolichol-phosphate mannosyltransferase
MLDLAIIVPTLNERDNIAPFVDQLTAALKDNSSRISWELIFVDDNSLDGTADEIRRVSVYAPRIRVLQRFGRRGLASAVIEGMCATTAQVVAVMDADMQHDPTLLPGMLACVREGPDRPLFDIVVASRFRDGGNADGLKSVRREKASSLGNSIARMISGFEISDPMSGFFAMRTEQARSLAPKLSGVGFKILLDILAVAPRDVRVHEISLKLAERKTGESKLDQAILFDFLVGLYDRTLGRLIPTRFSMFGTVGTLGVGVHLMVLSLLYLIAGNSFVAASVVATFVAMTFNFWLNNWLTYRDQRLRGLGAVLRGWMGFCLTCSVGALANVAVATLLEARSVNWLLAALTGIIIGSVWNYALSSRFVWGRY